MTAKEYLAQFRWLSQEIAIKSDELERLRTIAESSSAPELTGMPGSHNGSDRIGSLAVKIVELEQKIIRRRLDLIDTEKRILEEIDSMPIILHRLILTKRYLEFKEWNDIAEDLNYSVQRCFQIHGEALRSFSRINMKH